MKNETHLNGFLSANQKNDNNNYNKANNNTSNNITNLNFIKNKTAYNNIFFGACKPMKYSKSALQKDIDIDLNINSENKVSKRTKNKNIPGYLYLREFENLQHSKNSSFIMRNHNNNNIINNHVNSNLQTNKLLSKSYNSFAFSTFSKKEPVNFLTGDIINLHLYLNNQFNTVSHHKKRKNNNYYSNNNNIGNNNGFISKKNILPYLYRNLHIKKLCNKNNNIVIENNINNNNIYCDDYYDYHNKTKKQKPNINIFDKKNTIYTTNINKKEKEIIKKVFVNKNNFNSAIDKMEMKFNKHKYKPKNTIKRNNENDININFKLKNSRYNIYDGNGLKKNNSDLFLLNQDIYCCNYNNNISNNNIINNNNNSKYIKKEKSNIFRKSNYNCGLNDYKIAKLIKQENSSDIFSNYNDCNNKVSQNLLNTNAKMDKQLNNNENIYKNYIKNINNIFNKKNKDDKEIKIITKIKENKEKEKNIIKKELEEIKDNNYKVNKSETEKNIILNEDHEEHEDKLFNTNQKNFFKFRKDIKEEPDLEEETD